MFPSATVRNIGRVGGVRWCRVGRGVGGGERTQKSDVPSTQYQVEKIPVEPPVFSAPRNIRVAPASVNRNDMRSVPPMNGFADD
jgi:hypothetical protein